MDASEQRHDLQEKELERERETATANIERLDTADEAVISATCSERAHGIAPVDVDTLDSN